MDPDRWKGSIKMFEERQIILHTQMQYGNSKSYSYIFNINSYITSYTCNEYHWVSILGMSLPF